jgi:hypothetical protein
MTGPHAADAMPISMISLSGVSVVKRKIACLRIASISGPYAANAACLSSSEALIYIPSKSLMKLFSEKSCHIPAPS